MYEEIFKNSYEEIVIAGKLIVKLSKLLDEKKENTLEIKKETAETLEFLRSRVIYYRSAYQHVVLERKEMEDYCRNFQSCECGSYCDKKETCNPAEHRTTSIKYNRTESWCMQCRSYHIIQIVKMDRSL